METVRGRVIIIEGIDLAGKSTIVERIGKTFPGIIMKNTDRPLDNSPKERRKIKSYYQKILEFVNHNRTTNVILDRFFPSELAYSLPKRGYEAFDDKEFKDFERVIEALDHYVILCNPGIEKILERYKTRGDDYIVEADIEEIIKRYNRFAANSDLNILWLDTSKPVDELVDTIKKFINGEIASNRKDEY